MQRFAVHSRRAAYVALVVLTLVWGNNWIVMKLALTHADPVVYNVERTLVAIVTLLAVLAWLRRPFLPQSWLAVIVTGFFQVTINFGSTTMALSSGGVGRTSVLVFTMPFWTILLAWPVLNERLRGLQWLAVGLACAGLVLVVEPWNWQGELRPKLWATLSGFGWAAGTVATKYFQRKYRMDMLTFITWQMVLGILPLLPLPFLLSLPPSRWDVEYALCVFYTAVVSTAMGFVLWIAVLRWLSAGTASLNMLAIPVIAITTSILFVGERLTRVEWTGIACLGAGLVIVSLHAWRESRRGGAPIVAPTPLEGG